MKKKNKTPSSNEMAAKIISNTDHIREDLNKLKAEKNHVNQTGSRYPLFHHMVNEYGLHLLDSQIDDISLIAADINGIKSIREDLEKWKYDKKEAADRMFELKLRVSRLKAENQKLREALEYAIKALSVVTSSVIQKSILPELKEALKGVSDEK